MQNNHTTHCTTTFGTLSMLNEKQRLSFMIINIIIAILNVLVNVVATSIIVKTRQIKNQSIKLVFYLSISNIAFGLVGQPIIAAILYYGTDLGCTPMRLMLFVIELFLYSSTYLTGMLGFDRFIRIRYLNSYSQVYTKFRFMLSMVLLYMLIGLQSGLGVMSRFLNLSAVFITLPINILVFATVAFFYGRSIFILKQHEQNVKKLTRSRKTVHLTRLASLYIASDVIFSVPLVLTLGVYYFLRKNPLIDIELKGLLFYSCFLFFVCHCPVNAICFLAVNRKAKSRIPGTSRSSDNLNDSSFNDTLVSHQPYHHQLAHDTKL